MTNIKTLTATAVFAFGLGFASAAGAASLGTLTNTFTPGTGNSSVNFMIDTNSGEGIEVGIKAKERFIGDLPATPGGVYSATAGESDPGLATWNFDFSVAVNGTDDGSTIGDYSVFFRIDFNPAIGNTDVAILPSDPAADGLDLLQGSQNLGFGFWQLLGNSNISPFDPFATGEYELGIDVYDANQTTMLASTTAFVNVAAPIPVPAGLPLVLGGLGALYAMKRRQKRV